MNNEPTGGAELAKTTLLAFGGVLPYVAAFIALVFAFGLLYELIMGFRSVQENDIMGVSRAGAYLGYGVAVLGSLIQGTEGTGGYWSELGLMLLDGVIAGAVFVAAIYIFDWVILRHVDNAEQIRLGNSAAAWLEFCAYVALGLIVAASFSGGSPDFVTGLVSSLAFSGIGLGTLMAVYVLACMVWASLGQGNVDKRVAEGDMSAAISAGSLLLAMSVTLFFSISGSYQGWLNDILSYSVAAASSILVVAISRMATPLVWKLVTRCEPTPVGKASVAGALSVGVGLLAGLVAFV